MSEYYPLNYYSAINCFGRENTLLPEFLSFRFLNTETMTRRFPSTSTTVVKIKMLAKVAITQAGRVFSSSGRPCSVLVRLCRSGGASGITTAPLWAHAAASSPAHTARHSDTLARIVHFDFPMAPKQLVLP